MLQLLRSLASSWLSIFFATFSIKVIWTTLPLYILWILVEALQETKEGVSKESAIINGVAVAFTGINWLRETVLYSGIIWYKIFLSGILIMLGIIAAYCGFCEIYLYEILGSAKTTYYFMIMLSPLIAGVVEFSALSIASVLLFYPIVYFSLRAIEKVRRGY